MPIEIKQNCPLNNFKSCEQFGCAWFTNIKGTNPNTGQEIDEYGCAMSWLPILLIDTAKETRQAGAAVESLRNVVADKTPQPVNQRIEVNHG